MRLRYCCNQERRTPAIRQSVIFIGILIATTLSPCAVAGDAPAWAHALVNAPVPEHEPDTDAVMLYSETVVTVVSSNRIKTEVREAYKILRPEGRDRGTVWVFLNSHKKVKSLHGWCIPAQGKDYEVKDKDSLETSPPMIAGIELIQDFKARVLHIPAPDPGNIVAYEYETEEDPFFLQQTWNFQYWDPVRESRYTLRLPAGWEFKTAWVNHPEVQPSQSSNNEWQWTVADIRGLRHETDMPPFDGLRGRMTVTFFRSGGSSPNAFADWKAVGKWYWSLTLDRLDSSPQIKREVASLTASQTAPLEKMQALASFVQREVRYVAIELGIGGWQPHPASEVFSNRYGDCKDKATLLRSMLHEIGIDSYNVVIYNERGAVTPESPAGAQEFNHVIDAIPLPENVSDSSLVAVVRHPRLGRLLFFDPTDEVTPFGQIRGDLQENYGLLVTSNGGELVELPKQPSDLNSIQRTATLTLDPSGTLKGKVVETRMGDRARSERYRLLTVSSDRDRIKPIESLLSNSLSSFQITHARFLNLQQKDLPFGWEYSFEAQNYAKNAGDLLLVRPRVLGNKALTFLETKEARTFPIEFDAPTLDTDSFDITIPDGYVVDDLPAAVDADYDFASYHSKTEVKGNLIHYSRRFEIKELSLPVARAGELKKFYRMIAADERSTAVLKPGTSPTQKKSPTTPGSSPPPGEPNQAPGNGAKPATGGTP